MAKLVEDTLKKNQFEGKPFSYERDSRTFLVGSQQIEIANFGIEELFCVEGLEEIVTDFDSSVYAGQWILLGTPRLYEFTRDEERVSAFRQDVVDAMVDAFEAYSEQTLPSLMNEPASFMGFSVVLYRSGHPVFNVLGSCANLGVIPEERRLQTEDIENGFTEYDFHNIDSRVQEVSLLAGLGHLASLANKDITRP